MTTYNDKILVPNANKDGLDTIHPETNTGNVYDFGSDKWLNDLVGIATVDKLGSVRPDGTSIKIDEEGVISAEIPVIQDATTTQKGIVQLNNTLTSTSITQASTANIAKLLKDDITATQQSITNHIGDSVAHNRFGTATGTNSLVLNLTPAPITLTAGMVIRFQNTTMNTGTVTLNVNSLGAKSVIKNDSTTLVSGDLKANGIYTVVYNGTSYVLENALNDIKFTNIENYDITYHVSNSGVDSDDRSGTLVQPFRTIAYALSRIPKLGAMPRRIMATSGYSSNETVRINGYSGASLEIIGNSSNKGIVQGFDIIDCTCRVRIVNMGTSISGNVSSLYDYAVSTEYCSSVDVSQCELNGNSFGVYSKHSKAYISSCSISGISGIVIGADTGAYITVEYVSGSNPASASTAYYASAGIIIGNKGTLTATTARSANIGGQIFMPA